MTSSEEPKVTVTRIKINDTIIGIVCVVALIGASFGGGYYYRYKSEPQVNKVTPEGNIKDNKVNKDPVKMTPDDKNKDLNCYYKSTPGLSLELDKFKKNRITASASLCDRKWNQNFDLVLDEYKNMITLNFITVYDNQDKKLALGGQISYYRLYGAFGFGGGFSYLNNQTYGIHGGLIWRF